MTFAHRMERARTLENRVIAGLRARGWLAYPFGQGQIPDDARELLQRYTDAALRPTLLRWMPDVIALREQDGIDVRLIDAKAGDGPRYAIETRSLEAAEAFVRELFVPVFFVTEDGGVLTPRDARERGTQGPVTPTTGGSGTPYVLVEKRWARRFNDVFGEPLEQEKAA